MTAPRYTHVANFTGYMAAVAQHFRAQPAGLRILDLPAGNGLLADALRQAGHAVTCGDINRERPDYRYVDMSARLPFDDGEFDAVVCLEGVEHLLNPVALIAELARVTRRGGSIVVSTPNVMNFYSRLQYLFTGFPYQFNPAAVPQLAPGTAGDRGHVFPLSYFQLRYLFEAHGVRVERVLGDRYKRKALMPLYLALLPIAWLWSRRLLLVAGEPGVESRNRELLAHAHSAPLLFSRSLVLVMQKTGTRD